MLSEHLLPILGTDPLNSTIKAIVCLFIYPLWTAPVAQAGFTLTAVLPLSSLRGPMSAGIPMVSCCGQLCPTQFYLLSQLMDIWVLLVCPFVTNATVHIELGAW